MSFLRKQESIKIKIDSSPTGAYGPRWNNNASFNEHGRLPCKNSIERKKLPYLLKCGSFP
jgi:hypothetical protein